MRQLKIGQSITNRADKSLEKYLSDISKEEMITAEEETILARKIRNGDQDALQKLTKANLRFVVSVAKQYQNQGLPLIDIINEGNVGLIKAAKKFDETRGFKFISYAVWWIRQSILEALSEKSRIIRMPLNQVGVLGKINKVVCKLEQDLERMPTHEEISAALNILECKVSETITASLKSSSIDAPLGGNEDSSSMLEVLVNNDSPLADRMLIQESLKIEIERSLSTLDPRSKDVIKMFYGIDHICPISLDEIGHKLEISRERARQIKEKSIKKLRVSTRSKLLKSYLG
jgi:RNA polymerase primary sigma factor